MLLAGEPGPGGPSAASLQSQAGEWGQDLRLERLEKEGAENPQHDAEHPRRAPKDEEKALFT